jgi:hypothetical protein
MVYDVQRLADLCSEVKQKTAFLATFWQRFPKAANLCLGHFVSKSWIHDACILLMRGQCLFGKP